MQKLLVISASAKLYITYWPRLKTAGLKLENNQINDSCFTLNLRTVQSSFSSSTLLLSILIIHIITARGKGSEYTHRHTQEKDSAGHPPCRQRIFFIVWEINRGEQQKGEGSAGERMMVPSIKGCDLFLKRTVTLRSRRAHINPKCRFKLVSQAESRAAIILMYNWPTRPPAGEDGPLSCQLVRQDLAGISSSHVQRWYEELAHCWCLESTQKL